MTPRTSTLKGTLVTQPQKTTPIATTENAVQSFYYILIDEVANSATREEFCDWYETVDRVVQKTKTSNGSVSTVFLGLNHQYDDGPPLLFETMISDGSDDPQILRCSTWEQAIDQHYKALRSVAQKNAPISMLFTDLCDRYSTTKDPDRIVSLWDMLKIDSRPMFAAITYISVTVGEYKAFNQLSAKSHLFVLNSSLSQRAELINAIENLEWSCTEHGLTTTARLAKDARKQCYDILAPQEPITAATLNTLLPVLQGLPTSFVAEAESRKFFSMSNGADQYHRSADDLYGQQIVDAFPNAAFDIEEAGKCQAFGLWTASVMHTMRVLEIGLQALADHLQVEHGNNWNQTLNLIEGRLREVRKKVDGPDAEHWAAEVGTHLRFVKNAWRNQAMHPQAIYDEVRAKDIFASSRSLMAHLATKLSPDA